MDVPCDSAAVWILLGWIERYLKIRWLVYHQKESTSKADTIIVDYLCEIPYEAIAVSCNTADYLSIPANPHRVYFVPHS